MRNVVSNLLAGAGAVAGGGVSVELGGLGALLPRPALADLALVAGLGGAAAWMLSQSDTPNSPGREESLVQWLCQEDRVRPVGPLPSQLGQKKLDQEEEVEEDQVEVREVKSGQPGLNALSRPGQPGRFLTQPLFDLSRLRDTARFRGEAQRGKPDGEERQCEEENVVEAGECGRYCAAHRAEPRCRPLAGEMRAVARQAREVRRLIREVRVSTTDYIMLLQLSS